MSLVGIRRYAREGSAKVVRPVSPLSLLDTSKGFSVR
jgi:hypothetical protein